MHVVVKPFPWFSNGFSPEYLKVGDERDFGDDAAGLLSEKMIKAKSASTPPVDTAAAEKAAAEEAAAKAAAEEAKAKKNGK